MDISTTLAALADIELAVSITESGTVIPVRKVYESFPPASQKLDPRDMPLWINTWSFDSDQRGPFGVGREVYRITATMFVGEATGELARLVRQGRKLHSAFLAALRLNLTLGGTATAGHDVRGGEPTEGLTDRGGIEYVTYAHILEVPFWESADFALGVP